MTAAVLFLAVSMIGALGTLVALLPTRRPLSLALLYFWAGWLPSELPMLTIAWQAVATVVFALLGALREWEGWAGLAITLLSWCGLVVVQLGARRTGPVIERALADALGAEYGAAIAPELASQLRGHVPLRPLITPFHLRSGRLVERIKDISYGPAGKRNLLDVYRPRSGAQRCPVLLQIHGGAWVMGSKNAQGLPLMYHMAERGWVCIAPNYRLSPRDAFPAHLIDVKRALAWIREHGAEYGADPDFVAVAGDSAGAHLSALAALTANDPAYQPGFEHVDTSVVAAIPLYGMYDFLDQQDLRGGAKETGFLAKRVMQSSPTSARAQWEKASPLNRVQPGAPPFFVLHGTHDSLLLFEDTRAFVAALRTASSQPVAYAELPGAQHAFDMFHSVRSGHVVNGAARFLTWVRSVHSPVAAGSV
jgi:acetyl esterase/lipase